jgi:hypothetical protein
VSPTRWPIALSDTWPQVRFTRKFGIGSVVQPMGAGTAKYLSMHRPRRSGLREFIHLATARRRVAALGKLVAADDRGQAVSAVRELLRCAQQAGQSPERIWDWFASLTAAALSRRQYELVARVGLGVLLWNGVYLRGDPVLGGLGLGPTPPAAELALLVNCFEACTHLPERTILGRDSSAIFDVEMTRKWCQGGLDRLPLTDYLTNAVRPAHRKTGAPVVSDPSTRRRKDTEGSRAMNTSKVFVSYVREDSAVVDREDYLKVLSLIAAPASCAIVIK